MLNRHLYHSTTPEKYATLFLAIYDRSRRTLRYANAGHLPALLLRTDGSLRKLTSGGMVIGLFEEISIDEAEIELQPGDLVVAFSDGVTEPENEFGEFGEVRLIELLRENSQLPLARISDEITQAVNDWIGGAEQPDDLTLLLARPR
jgi:sigma-B regulation protein RsbU (phosphoserine phosphatase)